MSGRKKFKKHETMKRRKENFSLLLIIHKSDEKFKRKEQSFFVCGLIKLISSLYFHFNYKFSSNHHTLFSFVIFHILR